MTSSNPAARPAPASRSHHRVLILGGGSAGIGVAARLRRAGVDDVAVVEPSVDHWYQPLWTLVGGGCASIDSTRRPEAKVMPKGVTWIHDAAAAIEPDERRVLTDRGRSITYDQLIVCPGIQLDWDATPGLSETLGRGGVSSNYRADLAPRTWEFISDLSSGTAVFSMPTGPIKCAGAPQKIAYLAADHWQRQGLLDAIDVHLVLPTPAMFGIPEFAAVLDQVVERYGITVHLTSEVSELDPDRRELVVRDVNSGQTSTLGYDLFHVVPHQSAPDWIKTSPLAEDTPTGYVEIDKHSLRHVRWDNVWALGDAGSSPNSKTGAAARKQAKVVADNVTATLDGKPAPSRYMGYASCPIVTSNRTMLLAEFDYTMTHTKTVPLIDTVKERYDMWLLKRYGLPFLYWHLLLRGLA